MKIMVEIDLKYWIEICKEVVKMATSFFYLGGLFYSRSIRFYIYIFVIFVFLKMTASRGMALIVWLFVIRFIIGFVWFLLVRRIGIVRLEIVLRKGVKYFVKKFAFVSKKKS